MSNAVVRIIPTFDAGRSLFVAYAYRGDTLVASATGPDEQAACIDAAARYRAARTAK